MSNTNDYFNTRQIECRNQYNIIIQNEMRFQIIVKYKMLYAPKILNCRKHHGKQLPAKSRNIWARGEPSTSLPPKGLVEHNVKMNKLFRQFILLRRLNHQRYKEVKEAHNMASAVKQLLKTTKDCNTWAGGEPSTWFPPGRRDS